MEHAAPVRRALHRGAGDRGAALARSAAGARRPGGACTARCARLAPLSLSALLLTLVLLFGLQGEQIMRQPLVIALLAVPILIQVYFNAGLAYWLNRRLGVEWCVAGPSALIGACNFFELAVATAIALFGFQSGAALATVVGVLVEVPVMLSVVRLVRASRSWYERGSDGGRGQETNRLAVGKSLTHFTDFAPTARGSLACDGFPGRPRGAARCSHSAKSFGSCPRIQAIWHAHFPSLFRRAQWHIVTHLCTSGREGAAVGELYGLVKQVFLLDDLTVKERILEIKEQQLCVVDPPSAALSARSVIVPTPGLLDLFDRHLLALAKELCAVAASARSGDARCAATQARRGAARTSFNRSPGAASRAPGAGSHLRREQPVASAPCRGDPASQLALAPDAAAYGG